MRFFRNFPELRGHYGNPRSGLLFMGGWEYHILCVIADHQQCWNSTTYHRCYPILNIESSQVSDTTSTFIYLFIYVIIPQYVSILHAIPDH